MISGMILRNRSTSRRAATKMAKAYNEPRPLSTLDPQFLQLHDDFVALDSLGKPEPKDWPTPSGPATTYIPKSSLEGASRALAYAPALRQARHDVEDIIEHQGDSIKAETVEALARWKVGLPVFE